jgi:hypothetical protein
MCPLAANFEATQLKIELQPEKYLPFGLRMQYNKLMFHVKDKFRKI